MPARHLPVRPDLVQLRHQAKDMLRAIRHIEPDALADLQQFHPHPPSPGDARLADAQLTIARSYSIPSWTRLKQACSLIDAIWDDDIDLVRAMVTTHPSLLHEPARVNDPNWGPPMSYAANLGRDRLIEMLHALGAKDLEHATDRAVLQGKIGTAKLLHRLAGSPKPPSSMFGGAAYTLSATGTAFLLEIGAELKDAQGNADAPVDVVLQSDSRHPDAKHAILEMYAANGITLPDTPMMALHRGRIDLLEQHLARDAGLLTRTFSYADIFPSAFRCDQPKQPGIEDLPRTPIGGGTLLHACVEFDELEIARWLLECGMDANARAVVDADGFGGHTALFNAVVSYPHFWMNRFGGDPAVGSAFARLLLDAGADRGARASLRDGSGGAIALCWDITAAEWGARFHNRTVVSLPAIEVCHPAPG